MTCQAFFAPVTVFSTKNIKKTMPATDSLSYTNVIRFQKSEKLLVKRVDFAAG